MFWVFSTSVCSVASFPVDVSFASPSSLVVSVEIGVASWFCSAAFTIGKAKAHKIKIKDTRIILSKKEGVGSNIIPKKWKRK